MHKGKREYQKEVQDRVSRIFERRSTKDGLKDKVLAAHRGGIKTVILPEESKKDIRDIPKVVRNNVTLIAVTHMDQVIPIALSKELAVEGDENTPDPLLELLIAKEDEPAAKEEAPAVH